MDLLPIELLDKAMKFALENVYLGKLKAATPKESIHTSERWELRRNGLLDYTIYNDVLVGDGIPLVEILDLGHRKQYIEAKHRTKKGGKGFLKFEIPRQNKESKPKIPDNRSFTKDGFVFTQKIRGIRGTHFITEVLTNKSNMRLFERMVQHQIDRELANK